MSRLILLLSMTLFLNAGARAETFDAEVTRVTDGDTVWVRVGNDAPQQVRLRDIDAPEICQPRGREARAALAAQVLRRQVTVVVATRDEFQRLIAQLRIGRTDVGAAMVAAGWAWSPQWQQRRGPYAALQSQAQAARRGLWQDPEPEPPKAFRQRMGRCH